jgi:hypothetical protein
MSPSPTPTATVAVETLTVTLDGLLYEGGAGDESISLEDPEALLQLVEQLTGQPRTGVDIEDPWGQGDVMGVKYEWADIIVSVFGERANLIVRTPALGDVPVSTEEGITVGSSRSEALAAGARDGWDADGDGVADFLELGAREVPGTQSLSRPGEVGIEYLSLGMKGDVVERIDLPANDFSDL